MNFVKTFTRSPVVLQAVRIKLHRLAYLLFSFEFQLSILNIIRLCFPKSVVVLWQVGRFWPWTCCISSLGLVHTVCSLSDKIH